MTALELVRNKVPERSSVKTTVLGFFLLLISSCPAAKGEASPLTVVHQVDLQRYMGTWYEIASFPQWFQKGCTDTRADYRLREDGEIEVLNSCLRKGVPDTVKGRAWVADATAHAKLKVSIVWPFRSDYWIIELGTEYEYAVVSVPSREHLWILARKPVMDDDQFQAIVGRLKDRGFDMDRLQRTTHAKREVTERKHEAE